MSKPSDKNDEPTGKRAPGEGGARDDAGDGLPSDMAALLGALADGKEPVSGEEYARLEAELGSSAMREELASHRALLGELRTTAARAPSPDWRALEASIKRACDEEPVARRWSWARLRDLWRLPTLGVGAVAMASLALLLWQRAPRPAEDLLDAGPVVVRATPQPPTTLPTLVEADEADEATVIFDDEDLHADDIDVQAVGTLMAQLPADAAIALGANSAAQTGAALDEPADGDDSEELLDGTFTDELDREIDQLDAEALRALDQWLDKEQEGA